jgi:hypothetical protein
LISVGVRAEHASPSLFPRGHFSVSPEDSRPLSPILSADACALSRPPIAPPSSAPVRPPELPPSPTVPPPVPPAIDPPRPTPPAPHEPLSPERPTAPRKPVGQVATSVPALVREVIALGGQSAEGQEDSFVCRLAEEHTREMAATRVMGHGGADDRFAAMRSEGWDREGEIVAYTSETDPRTAAATCARAWRNSPGHWDIMKRRWDNYCFTMERGDDGYYCMGLVGNRGK